MTEKTEQGDYKADEYQEPVVKCRNSGCKTVLKGKYEKDVGYCLSCFIEMMSDEEE